MHVHANVLKVTTITDEIIAVLNRNLHAMPLLQLL